MSVSGDASSIDPRDASTREFTRVRKGFDPVEVRAHLGRLAEEIRRLSESEQRLRAELDTRRTDESSGEFDLAAVSRALGEETVRIIDAAREAADDIRAKAEENAGRVVRDAHERANRLTREATELREAAVAEAEELTSSARAEADEVLSAARTQSATLLADAESEAASLREEAALVLDEKTTEAQLEAVNIRQQAEDVLAEATADAEQRRADAENEARAIAERAEAEAAAVIEDAREQGREMVREAKEARERMIRDLAERRHTSRQQLEALRAGRERLIEAFSTAREALDEATDELVDALPSAREAADAAARAVEDDLEATARELDALIASGAEVDEMIAGVDPDDPRLATVSVFDAEAEAPEVAGPESDSVVEAGVEVETESETEAETESTAEVLVLETASAARDEDDDDEDDDDDLDDDDDEDDDFDDFDDDDEDDDELETDGSSAIDEHAAEPITGSHLRLVASNDGDPSPAGVEALAAATPATSEPSAAAAAAATGQVEELFARLRADHSPDDDLDDDDLDDDEDEDDEDDHEDEAPAARATDAGGPTTPGGVVIDLSAERRSDDAVAEAEGDLDDDDVSEHQRLLDRRDDLLSDLAPSLARRVRRVVSDQENELLDAVRRQRKARSSADLLGDRAATIEVFRSAVEKDLREIVVAGALFLDAGLEGSSGAVDVDEEAALDLVLAALGDWIVDPLRARLARVVDDSEDTSPDRSELVDEIRAVFREWRNDRLAELSGDLVTLAFGRGVIGASPAGQQLCWIVDHGGLGCADGEDNQLAGPVPVGDEFPTGDVCPPAHPGCRCLLVPASERLATS